jgi:2-amino-4-hydroxy-6-hydroxymethyldihydropteridine diphosphokinase
VRTPVGRRYAIAVGSNREGRRAHLAAAAGLLRLAGLPIVAASRLRETRPVGGPRGQSQFCNGVWIVSSALGPHQLLACLQGIERRLNRTREVRWGARTLDLDLLLDDRDSVLRSPVLELPHPRLCQRDFVLEPLREVAADWWHPLQRCRVRDIRLCPTQDLPICLR